MLAWTAFWVFMSRQVSWLAALTEREGTTPWASPLEWVISAMMILETIDSQYLMIFLLRAAVPESLAAQAERNSSIAMSLIAQSPYGTKVVPAGQPPELDSAATREQSFGIPTLPASHYLSGHAVKAVTRQRSARLLTTQVPPTPQPSAGSDSKRHPAFDNPMRFGHPQAPPAQSGADDAAGVNRVDNPLRPQPVPDSPSSDDDSPGPHHTGSAADGTASSPQRGVFMPRRKRSEASFSPAALRVAMVVTKAPSEPFEVVQKTLVAMRAQVGPGVPAVYDCWLADEDVAPTTLAWCTQHGVGVTCRKGIPEYHQKHWPRRTRCKEGNLAFFYDSVGYAAYDVVCQFDADHVPEPSYLSAVLPLFIDPRIGYVACPSICDANRDVSWAVRGRLYIEAYMHGPLRCSMTGALPACIGSHYCVRTSALKDIGGIGPELDEDWSTSFMMCAAGWKGAFAIDAIAHGDGPVCFEDAMRQEYQWSRSAALLLPYVWRLGWWLPLMGFLERLNVAYFFAFWPRSALYVTITLLCAVGPLWNITPFGPQAGAYVVFACLPYLVLAAHWLWIRSLGHLRPHDARLIAYEPIIHRLCAPIWMARGIAHGALGLLFRINFDIKVTPKGPGGVKPLPLSLLAPMLLLSLTGGISLMASSAARGNFMSAVYAFTYWLATMAVAVLHWRENGFGKATLLQRCNIAAPVTISLLVVGVVNILGALRVSGTSILSW